jgi:hypothetical protein
MVMCLAVAIKIEEEKKAKVERFLASTLLDDNIKITMQEAVGLMIDYALENKEELMKKFKDLPALEDDPAWKLLANPKHWGVKDASEKIDEALYGC